MKQINLRFDVGDTVHPIWILLKRCPTCGQFADCKPRLWHVLPPCIVTAVSFRRERSFERSFSGEPQGINYSLDRNELPYRVSESEAFVTQTEAEAECARRNERAAA